MAEKTGRRDVLVRLGAVGIVGSLAGCDGDGDDNDDPGGEGTPAGEASSDEVASFLEDAYNYDGLTVDRTGRDEVTVDVGAQAGGLNLAFDPAAVTISTGTTVVWEWTGAGGSHNVVAEDGSFDSGSAIAGSDVTFEHTFDEAGTYLYACLPHRTSGMKGAVVVE